MMKFNTYTIVKKTVQLLAGGLVAATMTSCGTHTGGGVVGGAILGGIVGGSDGAAAGALIGGAGGAVMDYDERSRYQEHSRRMREIDYNRYPTQRYSSGYYQRW
jgi:hypothetical protein